MQTPEKKADDRQPLVERKGKANVPLLSSYPVVNNLTPRARRRETLKEKATRKKQENEERARAAAKRRANENVGLVGNRKKSRMSVSTSYTKQPSLVKGRKVTNTTIPTKIDESENVSLTQFEKAQEEIDQLKSSMNTQNQKLEELKGSLCQTMDEKTTLENTLSVERVAFKELKVSMEEKLSENEKLAASLVVKNEQNAQLLKDKAWLQQEKERLEQLTADLRNTVLELKGNIRVFARVRPLQEREKVALPIFEYPLDDPDQEKITVVGEKQEAFDGRELPPKVWDFKFDKVFRERDTQENVFCREVSHLVQSVVDGYRVCIFAYGQTGSGKTFTMEGDANHKGIIPRAVDHVFTVLKSMEQEWKFEQSVSILEIYNEKLFDLASGTRKLLGEIRHSAKDQTTTVQGLSETMVSQPSDVQVILDRAATARSVSSTNCNERSSRSHSVFFLTLIGTHRATGERRRGVLNLVDLAGSERLADSKVSGQQLNETKAINKSLSCLGDVIFALGSGKKQHVPFRNSKLTYLLQNSLGGNSKTLMFVNLSPVNLNESLCTLRFGHKVNACEIGTARKM